MDYVWDPRKASDNLRKHGVDFADAVLALEDENALTIEDRDHDEPRFKTLGIARKADRKEVRQYYQGLSL
jgi:uncharacterized DUF497 family protein